jgi:hypothetical protein
MMVTMSDSDAVRQMRRRRHKGGDHSMCRRGCQDARVPLQLAPVPVGSGEDLDPVTGLRDLAAQLQAACRADPMNSALARELRSTLLALMPSNDGAMDREWRRLVDELSRPAPGRDDDLD